MPNSRAIWPLLDGRLHLVFADLDFGGELANDFLHVRTSPWRAMKRGSLP
jgi:hypothetical protein